MMEKKKPTMAELLKRIEALEATVWKLTMASRNGISVAAWDQLQAQG